MSCFFYSIFFWKSINFNPLLAKLGYSFSHFRSRSTQPFMDLNWW
jgi:hypothetical protein